MVRRCKLMQKPEIRFVSRELPSSNGREANENAQMATEEKFANIVVEFPDLGEFGSPEEKVDELGVVRSALKSWANKYEESIQRDGKLIAQLDVDEIEVEASFWKSAMICVVVGVNPPFAVFEGFIKRIWGNMGIEMVARMNARYTMVKFKDEATRDMVLETGVVHFDKKPVILQPWTTELDSLRLVKFVPVWIRLLDLGLQYWGVKCLSALVSTVGKPIMVDKVTKDRSMIKFARVLVDMEIADNPPKIISYINERGQLMDQIIEYEWLPTKFPHCKKFGHSEATCKRVIGVVWRKKEVKEQSSTKSGKIVNNDK
ncbi:uncharacterized protein LOC133795173 [Humulus lupulus]|uniref:uncharacterized protein LOC133795173 n=1 Tax=Humulus lupulus TaxID=3486 RepID=UPI002B40E595|nr:uncharacterized protein LOC133795173 [Humulus lupulus]